MLDQLLDDPEKTDDIFEYTTQRTTRDELRRPWSTDGRMRDVLIQMQMLMHGTTLNYAPSGSGGHASGEPSGEAHPPHLYWLGRYNRAVGPWQREQVFKEAKKELKLWRHRPETDVKPTPESEEEEGERIIMQGRGWSAEDVAQRFRCTPTRVRQIRSRAGVSPVTGDPPSGVTLRLVDERERAKRLADEGLSEKQIRMILGCGGSKLERLLSRAAA